MPGFRMELRSQAFLEHLTDLLFAVSLYQPFPLIHGAFVNDASDDVLNIFVYLQVVPFEAPEKRFE